ncbi:MAG: hypothetical protein R3Y68_02935 [Rikenellaceae bacterium]
MKKTFTTLALALAIIGSATAQRTAARGEKGTQMRRTPQSQSQSQGSEDEEFSLRYQINVAEVNASYDKNSEQIKEICNFINGDECGEKKRITKVAICGYTSPDGPAAANQRLATERATDFREYLDKRCSVAKVCGETKGVVWQWSDTKSAVESSSIPQKSRVLQLIESSQPQMVIEAKLRVLGDAWDYMVKNILPPMRCVEVEVFYAKCSPEPKPKAAAAAKPVVQEVVVVENNYLYYVDEDDSDLKVVENDYALPLDYEPREHMKFIFKENRRREKIKGDYRDIYGRERSTVKYK